MTSQNKKQAVSSNKCELSSNVRNQDYNMKNKRTLSLRLCRLLGVSTAFVFNEILSLHEWNCKKRKKEMEDNDYFFPVTVNWLKENTPYDDRTIRRAIHELVSQNIVLLKHIAGNNCAYRLVPREEWSIWGGTPDDIQSGQNDRTSPVKVAEQSGQSGRTPLTKWPDYGMPKIEDSKHLSSGRNGPYSNILKYTEINTETLLEGGSRPPMESEEFADKSQIEDKIPNNENEDIQPKKPKRVSVPGQIKRKTTAQTESREMIYAKKYHDYICQTFPSKVLNWNKQGQKWAKGLERVTRGKDAVASFEEVTAALDWLIANVRSDKSYQIHRDTIRSLARLDKPWMDGTTTAIQSLLKLYNSRSQNNGHWKSCVEKTSTGLILPTETNIKKVVRWTMKELGIKENFSDELKTQTDNLVSLLEWVNSITSGLPKENRDYWYDTERFLWETEKFVRVRFSFEDDDDFGEALEEWQDAIEEKAKKIKCLTAAMVDPQKIIVTKE